MPILVSVVVCTYNRVEILKGAIESLCSQTADSSLYEIIVVDNNSTDDTQKVVERFGNVHYYPETRQGLSHARNRGWQVAQGKYVAYIDDDAKAERNWLENVILFIKRCPDVVAFGGPYKGFSMIKKPEWYKESYGSWTLGEEERPIKPDEWINGTNMIFKRSLLEELGGFDVKLGMTGTRILYGEETNLLIKIRQNGHSIFYVPNIIVKHLIADYKLNLKWMFKSRFNNGVSALETFGLCKKPVKQVLVTVYTGLKGIGQLFFSKEKYFKSRLLESFSGFMMSLGLTIRMFKK